MIESQLLGGTDCGVCTDFTMELLDFPMETLGGDGVDDGDWEEKFQELAIPTEALWAVPNLSVHIEDSSELKQQTRFLEEASVLLQNDNSTGSSESGVFQSLSPVSVLEHSTTSENPVPVRARTKRLRSPTINIPWRLTPPPIPPTSKRSCHLKSFESKDIPESSLPNTVETCLKGKPRKKKKLSRITGGNAKVGKKSYSSQSPFATKRCSHCKVTTTPQWREGPLGPKTLCNACGVRFRSGRLVAEYRPAASPTFVPSIHSNSHRKIMEMVRNKATEREDTVEEEAQISPQESIEEIVVDERERPMSPPPELIPMTGFLYDCFFGEGKEHF